MTPRRLLLTSVFLWCAAIVATPALASYDGAAAKAAFFSYHFFSHVCHQLDSHSFHIAGFKFAVCIRCTFIYVSFFFGMLFFPMIKRTKITSLHSAHVLILSLIPMGIDVALDTFGIRSSTTMTRAITGSIFGLALSIVLLSVLEEFAGKFLTLVRSSVSTLHLSKQGDHANFHNQRNLQSALNLRNPSNQSRIDHATETR